MTTFGRAHPAAPRHRGAVPDLPLGRSYTTVPLPPLADIPADPDLTTVRARLHRLTRQAPPPRRPLPTTGPPDP